MNHRKPLASLTARSADIMSTLAAYIIPPNFALPKRWNGMMSEATKAARRPSWPPKQVFARGLTISVVAIALLALAAVFPFSTSADTVTLVTNHGKAAGDNQRARASTSFAQGFKTGSLPENAIGFTLSAAEWRSGGTFYPGDFDKSKLTASIRSVGTDDNPGDVLYELTTPDNPAQDDFNAPTGAMLEPETSYFLMMEYDNAADDRNLILSTTTSNSEDSKSRKGWTIYNDRHNYDVDDGTWSTSSSSLRIEIKGEVVLETPANLTAEVLAPQQVRLTWDQVFELTKDDYDPEEFPGYDIRWSADGESSWRRLVYWNAYYGRRFYDSTIPPGTTRYYRIRAVSKNGDESAYSNVVSVTTPGLVDSGNEQIRPGVWASELDALNDQKVFRANLVVYQH